MAKIGRWLAYVSGVVLLLAVALYVASRWWPVPAAQRTALAQLRQPLPPLRGPNLFVDLWLLPYSVPSAQRQALLDEDVRRFRHRPVGVAFRSAASRYPRVPDWPTAGPPRCSWRGDDCIAKVRAARQAYAAALATQAPLLAAMPAASGAAEYRSPFTDSTDLQLPAFSLLQIPLTQHALDFVEGRRDAALQGVCSDAAVARALLGSGDNLITAIIGASMLRGNARLFADMLAELPPQALPAQCTQAFAPLQIDGVSLCRSLRGEAHWAFAAFDELASGRHAVQRRWYESALIPLALNAERSKARLAPGFTRACADDARATLIADLPPTAAQVSAPVAELSMGCVANALGCAMTREPQTSFVSYQASLQDAAATMRLASALLWLSAHPGTQPLPQRLAALPADLRGARRPLQATADGQALQVALYADSDGDTLRLPLPGSRRRP
ncbi:MULTISPECIES: hypothetical protein [Xanthomonas]|uniref:hypothetical protein n=1 Tax=Xanthomonas TaxID=338 RepID=UPI001ADCE33C|nr:MULTISPECIES: hypothetical protein [unclassified Xanthomonas]MBO9874918.1 hypothetical protein [Xanthomonas sp. D-93]WNH43718.1 hypothetical protein PG878_14445 [Xanthomonas sp. A6251]